MLDALEWGVWDHSPGTPRVCIFARPLKGAVAHTDVLQAKLDEEVDKGFVRRRRGLPWSVPAVARRTNVIPKGAAVDGAPQRWRCVVGRSDGELVWVFGGVREMPAAPNANTEKTELPELRWTSLQSVMEGGTCVADATRLVGGSVFGGTYDAKDWFRQLAACATERWKGAYKVGGAWVEDLRLQMGGVAAATIAHRMGMLIAVLLLENLDEALRKLLGEELDGEDAAAAREAEGPWLGPLRAWRAERRATCAGAPGADRPAELPVRFHVPGAGGARVLGGKVIRGSLREWEVGLSGKEKPLAPVFESIGGRFVYCPEERRIRLGPREETVARLKKAEARLRALSPPGGPAGAGEEEAEEGAAAEAAADVRGARLPRRAGEGRGAAGMVRPLCGRRGAVVLQAPAVPALAAESPAAAGPGGAPRRV